MKKLAAIILSLLPLLAATAQQTELTSQEAKTLYKNTTKKRVSVHDPSVVWDSINTPNRYYIIGSHRGVAYSTDMQNWTGTSEQFAKVNEDGSVTTVSTSGGQMEANLRQVFSRHRTTTITKDGQQVAFGNYDATDWVRAIPDNNGNWDVNGVMWAPDMVWNPVMQKWCQYLSLNGNAWNSVIVLLTADKLTGPWVYEGPVVYSGFRSPSDPRVSWKKTDLELVIGEQASLPARYNHTSSGNGQMWGDWWPNNIDPCVFYDEEGELWISYGSWSGGIWTLKLNKENGLRDYDVTYPSTGYSSSSKNVTSDPYFGKKIAGGCYVSGEGPYIEHIGQYYYLFMSYGGFAPDGGYEMRVFRSENPDGPYKDAQGHSAIFTQWVLNYGGASADRRGEKIMGAYNGWGFQTVGECAQGHNSVIAAEDGRTYLIYHTKFNDGTIGHQVRVHQLFLNSDGWLVAAPFEYNGEELTDADMAQPTPLTAQDIAGTYDILVHKYAMDHNNMEEVTPVQISLEEDGTVRSTYVGTWAIDEGTSYLTIRLGATTYKGVILEEVMDQRNLHAVAFTACSGSGVNVWGYKRAPKYALAWQLNNQSLPVTNNQSVLQNLNLDALWQGDPNVTMHWSSSHPDIISEHGRYNPTGLTDDTDVTLTARLSAAGYYWQQEFTVKALSEQNALPTADWQTGMVAHYGFDDEALANSLNSGEQAELLRQSTTKVPALEDGDALRNGRYVHLNSGNVNRESFVQMPNPLYGHQLDEGATLCFWLRRTDANLWGTLYGFTAGDARLFMTGNLYTGYNDGAGNWLDINHPDRVKTSELKTAQWQLVTVVFKRTATSSTGGVTVYVDGVQKRNDNFNGQLGDKTISTKAAFEYGRIVDLLTASPTLCLGKGSFWGTPDACFDDVIVYDQPLSLSQIIYLNQMMNRVFNFSSLSSGIEALHPSPFTPHPSPFTLHPASVFDMQGRHVSQPQKGLYIINGKKQIIR